MSKGFIPFQGAGLTFIGLETGQTSVTASVTQIVAAESSRGRLLLMNTSTDVLVYVSENSAVTITNGYPLQPQQHVQLEYTGALYGIVQTTTTIIGWGKLQ